MFLKNLKKEILLYLKHDHVAESQAQYLYNIKNNLQEGEFLVTLDFAENYSFKIQDAVQSYHWSNDQATLHPYVIYHKNGETVVHECFVVISDNNKHDTVAVHLFNKKMLDHIKLIFGEENVRRLIFFSDGCGGQYKNKYNFTNLCHYKDDFNVETEWHFFATSHGKGACDGVGGTVKRLASRASLQRPDDQQITTPFQLFQWAEQYFENISFEFCSKSEYEKEESALKKRFEKAATIKGTRLYHSFIPLDSNSIACREISCSEDFDVHSVV